MVATARSLITLLSLFGMLEGVAQAEPATTQFESWLTAFNSGDKAAIQKFYGERLGDADALSARNLRIETCGFDLARVEDKSNESFRALLVQRCFPALFRVSFSVAKTGQTLEKFKLQPFAMPEARSLAATRDIAERLAASDSFAGYIIVAKDGETPWTYSVGTLSRDDARPINADSPMFLASAGKMFTAVSIFQLIEKGKVQLDAPLSRYLPDYPNKEMGRVTIRNLLGHRGGTGEDGVLQREDTANRAWVRTIDDYIKLNGSRPPAFPPGSKFDYSNYGFILLGAVIEKVSGQSYPAYVQQHIFDPAEMTHASFPDCNTSRTFQSVIPPFSKPSLSPFRPPQCFPGADRPPEAVWPARPTCSASSTHSIRTCYCPLSLARWPPHRVRRVGMASGSSPRRGQASALGAWRFWIRDECRGAALPQRQNNFHLHSHPRHGLRSAHLCVVRSSVRLNRIAVSHPRSVGSTWLHKPLKIPPDFAAPVGNDFDR